MDARTAPAGDALLGQRLERRLRDARDRLRRYRKFRTTLSELTSLTDRDLSDLGLSRPMLRAIAWDSASDG